MWKQFVIKYRVLIIAEVILFLTFLFVGMSKEKLAFSTDWTSELERAEGRSAFVKLVPGVYRLQASAQAMSDEEYLYFDVASDKSTYKAIRCDGGMIRGAQKKVDFEVYVIDTVEEAYITCDSAGATSFTIDNIALTRTALGERMICFITLALSLLLNTLLVLRDKILSGAVTKEQKWSYVILLIGLFISYFPYMTDYFSLVGDVPHSCLRIEHIGEMRGDWNVLGLRHIFSECAGLCRSGGAG